MGGGKRMRLPGIEPGPSRWQRDIITTRLKALFAAVGGFQLPQSINHRFSSWKQKAPRRGIEPRASA